MTEAAEKLFRTLAYNKATKRAAIMVYPTEEKAQREGAAGYEITEYIRKDVADALLKAEREKALREAAEVCTNVIKNYDVMEPGKPNQFASLKTQKAAKGMVSLARQDIEALIKKDRTDG